MIFRYTKTAGALSTFHPQPPSLSLSPIPIQIITSQALKLRADEYFFGFSTKKELIASANHLRRYSVETINGNGTDIGNSLHIDLWNCREQCTTISFHLHVVFNYMNRILCFCVHSWYPLVRSMMGLIDSLILDSNQTITDDVQNSVTNRAINEKVKYSNAALKRPCSRTNCLTLD